MKSTAPGGPVISLQGVTKKYGRARGVSDLTLDIQPGQIFGFLGPNGAGKTTTIRLILDLLRPSSGKISVFGIPLPDNSTTIRQRCGYLSGEFSTYGHMTISEFLNFLTEMRGISNSPDLSLIERFHLRESLGRKIRHLSHGNLQKLGIIQAFLHNPELVILDEPSTGLDPLMKAEFYEFLFEYRKTGKTIFFSSHDLSEVERVCDRVCIIRDGQLVALESIENLKRNRVRRLRILLKNPVEKLTIPDAQMVYQRGLEYEFHYRGNIAQLPEILSGLPIEDFDFPEPSLEEVFMVYYRKNSHD